MTAHVTSSFVIDTWNEQVALDDAKTGKLVRTAITKTFSGGITGTSVAEMVMAGCGESMAYSGFERMAVTIDGKSGTFLLNHNAAKWNGGGTASWTVLEGSGTGDLARIRGTVTIARHDDGSHSFTLDYDLD